MKKKNLLIALTIVVSFTACKKNTASGGGVADSTTLDITTQAMISDNLNEDANTVFTSSVNSDSTGSLGARPAPYYNAIVTISPGVFPKTVTINFGTGTTSPDGIIRSGEIIAVLSDSFYKTGSYDTLTFNNYTVNGYHKEGTIVWTNLSQGGTLAWTRVDSGTVTAPGGLSYWHHYGTTSVLQTGGIGDNNLPDNVYSISWNSHTIVNSAGVTAISVVLPITPLEKKADCPYIDAGQLVISVGSNQMLINFGDGTCDDIASYSYNNGSFQNFTF